MKHSELIRSMAAELGSIAKAEVAHDAFVRAFYLGIAREGKVSVKDVGTFRLTIVKGGRQDNLLGGSDKARTSHRVNFRMASALKRALRREE